MPLKKTLKDMAEQARRDVPELTAHDLASRLPDVAERQPDAAPAEKSKTPAQGGKTPVVLDVREESERQRDGFIPTSIGLPRGILERDIAKKVFSKPVTDEELNHPIVCYCGGGSRSLLAARSLQEMGFTNVASLAGGFEAWEKAHLPIVSDE